MTEACEKIITQAKLKSILLYAPSTGRFTYLKRVNSRCPVGKQAGSLSKRGYWVVRINYRIYYAHQLAWLYMTGTYAGSDIDHRDGDKLNNRWKNLRLASDSQNLANQKLRLDNTSGVKGVVWWKNRWTAQLHHNGRNFYLGRYHSKEEARVAYAKKAKEVFGEFARPT